MIEKHGMGHGIYIGPEMALKGEAALLMRSEKPGRFVAQFDKVPLIFNEKELHFNWHEFSNKDFVLDRELS